MSTDINVSNRRRGLNRIAPRVIFAAFAVLTLFFSEAHAQGLGGLGQLLGGGSGGSRNQQRNSNSNQPSNAITVERNIAPYVGRFAGKQKASSYQGDLNANFACYPAHDAELPESRTFVCYTAEQQPRAPDEQQQHLPE
ncbi:MAG TPA: hypothetical protein VGI29_06335 [Candidatus Binataceae bacterium]|jgi:hypothetical protein